MGGVEHAYRKLSRGRQRKLGRDAVWGEDTTGHEPRDCGARDNFAEREAGATRQNMQGRGYANPTGGHLEDSW